MSSTASTEEPTDLVQHVLQLLWNHLPYDLQLIRNQSRGCNLSISSCIRGRFQEPTLPVSMTPGHVRAGPSRPSTRNPTPRRTGPSAECLGLDEHGLQGDGGIHRPARTLAAGGLWFYGASAGRKLLRSPTEDPKRLGL